MLVGEDYSKYCRGRKQRIAGCILTPIGACTLGASLYLSYVGLITTAFGKPVPLYAGIALNAFGGAAFWPPASPPCGAAAATSRKSPPGTIAERRAPKSHSGQQETESASPSGSKCCGIPDIFCWHEKSQCIYTYHFPFILKIVIFAAEAVEA